MTVGQPSGTYNFASQFSNGELLFDAFERCGKAPSELTQTMLASARRSLNLLLQSLANQGPNLWAVDLQTVILQQGIATINLPQSTASVLDVYVRQYVNTNTIDEAVSFSTISGSTAVNIYQPAHGLSVGNTIFLITQVSVGGLILVGYYLVTAVPDQDDFTITAASAATSTVTNGGAVPQFTTVITSQNVTVTLPAHGQVVGTGFDVPISTDVGGITLFGSYMVTSITDANNFVINSAQTATSSTSTYLNGGEVQIDEQDSSSVPTDRVLTPMSRTDYNSLPNKNQQGFPYSFWYDRLVQPTMTFWQVPDQNGPYLLNYYRLRQLQDANLGMGEIPDVQYRGLEMLTARLAVKLSVKYAIDRYKILKGEAIEEFGNWEEEDREKVPLFIQPQVGRYYRG